MSKAERKTRTQKITLNAFEAAIKDATGAFSNAQEKFENVQLFIDQMQSKLIEAFTQAAKTFDSTINPDRLQSFIEAFVKKPYFVIPMSEKEWWLVVPSFVTLEFGYLLAQEGAWNIFLVNQYSGMIQDIPEEFKREIELAKPFGDMEIKGDKLILKSSADDVREVQSTFQEFLGAVKDKKTILIQKGKEIELFAALVRQGILPFKFNKVKEKHKLKESRFTAKLRDYQLKDYGIFENSTGAIGLTYPMGGGKSFPVLKAISDLIGQKLILVPNHSVGANWKSYVLEHTTITEDQIATDFSPKALEESLKKEIHIIVYHQANYDKIKDIHYIFACFDEAPSVITEERIKFAMQLNIEYRITTTGTPFREDGYEDLIYAIMVKPLGVDWQYFIDNDLIKTPEIKIWIESDQEAKMIRLGELLDFKKKTLIFCDNKKLGYALAERYNIPFVSGDVKKADERIQIIRDNKVVVVSRVGDMGISIKDIEVIIEIDFLFGSRQQATQRVGRLFHSEEEGIYHVLMTALEYVKYKKRFLELYRHGLKVSIEKSSELPFDLTQVADQVKKVSKRKKKSTAEAKKKTRKTKFDLVELAKKIPLSERTKVNKELVLYLLNTDHANEKGGMSTSEMRAVIEGNNLDGLSLAKRNKKERAYWLNLYRLVDTMYKKDEKIERRTVEGVKVFFIMNKTRS